MDKTELNKKGNDTEAVKPRSRKEWIKNIIILFLLIMLLLTFFSNTIMNYSLPEVSVVKMSRDSVSKNYQLDLMVEANKTYEVTADEARDIKRVAVKKGQDVKEGQALFYLQEVKDSTEVKTLQEQIDTEKVAYEKAIMTAAADYFDLNLAIQQARDTLNKAINDKNNAGSGNSEPTIDNSVQIAELTNRKQVLQNDSALFSTQGYASLSDGTRQQLSEQLNKYNVAKSEYDAAAAALEALKGSYQGASIESDMQSMSRNIEKLELELSRLVADKADARVIEDKEREIKYAKEDHEKLKKLSESITAAQAKLNEKTPAFNTATDNLNVKAFEVKSSIDSELLSIDSQIASLQASQSVPPSGMGEAGAGVDYDAAITAAQYALSTATHALEAKMAEDKRTDAQTQIDLDAQKKKIEKLEADLQKLLSKESKTQIDSPVSGVVEEIAVTAGQSVIENDKLMILNISDDGFTASADVTSEQNKRLSKGKTAKVVSPGFENTVVTIKSITKSKADSSKFTVTFTIAGDDIVAGQNLKIELGESATTFDSVVPKSAVKEDSGGKFVYTVKSKSTPLGNRYIVEKVVVTIMAEDDTQCAISGEFGESADYIITAASKPFTSGDQVRFAEE